ncbi:MAG TPA: type I restriction endonuclease [Pirellulales bacterium]|nr:type I restriction endonuclease [Pirellulales bacterium]
MLEAVSTYVKRVRELADHVKGNEQATKKSLVEPLFTLLGYDLTDPRECVPEYREDFGKNRSVKPVDYAFFQNGSAIFFVEAKEVSKKLTGYDEQLGDYFAKSAGAKIGILTNGVTWRFFSDIEHDNIMDKRPFVEWHVLNDEPAPWDFLNLLQKQKYSPELIRTFAERQRKQNLLVEELARLLEPAPEFVRLAVERIETRNLTAAVVESWKPVLKAAIVEWAKQQRLSSALSTAAVIIPIASERKIDPKIVETTEAELQGFEIAKQLLGPDKPIEYTDTVSYFKMHLASRPSRAFCRLFRFGERASAISVALEIEIVKPLLPLLDVSSHQAGWTRICGAIDELKSMHDVLKLAWDRRNTSGSADEAEDATETVA